MIYILDKKLWANGNEAVVRTDLGEVVIKLEKNFSIRGKIIVYDKYHVEIGKIEKKVFKSGFNYDIYFDDVVIGTLIKRSRLIFWKEYAVINPNGSSYSISGKLDQFDATIKYLRAPAARISTKYAHKSHQFGMETNDEERRYLFICLAVIMATVPLT